MNKNKLIEALKTSTMVTSILTFVSAVIFSVDWIISMLNTSAYYALLFIPIIFVCAFVLYFFID